MQQHLLNHFCTSRHCSFLQDVSITFTDETDPSDLLKWEEYCRNTLKIMARFRPNTDENV